VDILAKFALQLWDARCLQTDVERFATPVRVVQSSEEPLKVCTRFRDAVAPFETRLVSGRLVEASRQPSIVPRKMAISLSTPLICILTGASLSVAAHRAAGMTGSVATVAALVI
jgi:hypothetical protein